MLIDAPSHLVNDDDDLLDGWSVIILYDPMLTVGLESGSAV